MNILERLANSARSRVKQAKESVSSEDIKDKAYSVKKGEFEFEKALKKTGLSFICECKKASPSNGIIAQEFPYKEIAKEYEKAGGDAVSVLTEPTEFLGSDKYLEEIAQSVNLPCLRKDFIIDEYMIYEAKILGAKAFLLIVSLLSEDELKSYVKIGESLGMSALVETRDEIEIKRAVDAGARIIGVNNRNLKDFSVDVTHSAKLIELIPQNTLFVAESGIKTASDVKKMRDIGANAVLIGEALMLARDKRAKLNELKGEL